MKLRTLTVALFAAVLIFAGTSNGLAQSLTVTADLQLWLKADAGVTLNPSGGVAQWDDQSGQGNHAVQSVESSAPANVANAVNSKPALLFDGVDDYLSVASSPSIAITGDLTSYFVVRFTDFSNFRAVWAKTANNLPAPTDYYAVPGTGRPQVYRGNGTATGLGNFQSAVGLTAGSFLTVGFGIEGSTCSHFLAGQAASSGTLVATTGDTGAPLLIGTRGDLFTKMKGEIAEILIYSRALTPTERNAVADYLAQKYGIVNLPPTISLGVTPAGPSVPAGTEVTVTATAADADGSVAKVEFFVNGSSIGVATAPPYRMRATLDTPGNYDFTARVTDNKDAIADSTPVSRTVGSGSTPALGVTANLQVWLKADAGVTTGLNNDVVTWEDQSGHGNHATAAGESSAPIVAAGAVNSLPALRFDGVDDQLMVADSASVSFPGDLTTFFVVKMDDFATFRAVWAKTAGPGGNLPAPTDFYTLPGNGIPRVYRGDGTPTSLGASDGGRALHAGAFDLVGFSVAGGSVSHYLGGFDNGSGTVPTLTADGDTPLYIGTRHDQFTRLKGDLAEVLIYDTALSTSDRRSVETYLASRHGMPLATVVNTPPIADLTAPAPGTVVVAPADVVLSANASDADGSIVRVEFLINGAIAATDTTSPYSVTVNFPVASTASVQARAIDNLGRSTVSAPVTIQVDPAEVIPLPLLSDLKLWLRADKGVTEAGGTVSAWNDQSGNFNNAVQTAGVSQPALIADAINGRPALRFDGGDDSMVIAHSPTLAIVGDITTFFVVRIDDFVNYRAVWAKTQVNFPASTDWYTVPTSGRPRVFRGNGSSGGFSDATVSPTPGQFEIIGFDQGGTTLHHYLNGEANGEGTITATMADTGAPVYIGTRGDQFTRMKGDIAEVIIYNSRLSDTDRGTVINYLGRRYGIATTPQLSIVNNFDSTVTVSWPITVVGWSLQVAPNPQGPWDTVTFGVVDNTFIDFTGDHGFYRLIKP